MISTPPAPGPENFGPEDFRAMTGVSRETLVRLEHYAALLEKWSQSINLVGRRSLPDLWRRHMLDSAQLLDLLPPPPPDRPRRMIDLGSGAGFPGLVLAILGAGDVHLVEADQKRAAFLREAARATGAEVSVHAVRIESLPPMPAEVVTARALAPLPKLLDLAEGLLCANTQGKQANEEANSSVRVRSPCSLRRSLPVGLFLKGAEAERELTDSLETWMMQAEVFPSRSDPRGRILRLSGLARKEP